MPFSVVRAEVFTLQTPKTAVLWEVW